MKLIQSAMNAREEVKGMPGRAGLLLTALLLNS